MGSRAKRRRLNELAEEVSIDDICKFADEEEEKKQWNGFCEIESEPALFNFMLRKFGVKGVKVQEVISLDEEMMAFLNKPIYGLIYLFRWREDDEEKQETTCPDGIWFANQIGSNSCATVALLNIINNIPNIDLGEHLQGFKEGTMGLTPAFRGLAANNFEPLKQIHNSFARKMDILNTDLQLCWEAQSKKRSKSQVSNESDSGFHFIAFMPAMDQVWKFDGLERQPQALGECSPDDDWLELAKPDILERMAAYAEGDIEFSILGLVRDPLPDLIQQLAGNVRCLKCVRERLASLQDPALRTEAYSQVENTVLQSLGLKEADINTAVISESMLTEFRDSSPMELRRFEHELSDAQRELLGRALEEKQAQQADDDYSTGRRYDYGPAIRAWLRSLARKQVLDDLLQ